MWVIVKEIAPENPFKQLVNQPTVIHHEELVVRAESERLANNNVGDTFVVYELVKIGESKAKKARFESTLP